MQQRVGTTWASGKGWKKWSLVIEQEQRGESRIKGLFLLSHTEEEMRAAELRVQGFLCLRLQRDAMQCI